jgi:hypothetical protein
MYLIASLTMKAYQSGVPTSCRLMSMKSHEEKGLEEDLLFLRISYAFYASFSLLVDFTIGLQPHEE